MVEVYLFSFSFLSYFRTSTIGVFAAGCGAVSLKSTPLWSVQLSFGKLLVEMLSFLC